MGPLPNVPRWTGTWRRFTGDRTSTAGILPAATCRTLPGVSYGRALGGPGTAGWTPLHPTFHLLACHAPALCGPAGRCATPGARHHAFHHAATTHLPHTHSPHWTGRTTAIPTRSVPHALRRVPFYAAADGHHSRHGRASLPDAFGVASTYLPATPTFAYPTPAGCASWWAALRDWEAGCGMTGAK